MGVFQTATRRDHGLVALETDLHVAQPASANATSFSLVRSTADVIGWIQPDIAGVLYEFDQILRAVVRRRKWICSTPSPQAR